MSKAKIILVEDDETDVILFQRLCAREGMSADIIVARDGGEALHILRSNDVGERDLSPYVVVTDLNMQGVSGHELIEKIRGDQGLKDSVVFVLSTSDLPSDVQRAYNAGISGYLVKDEDEERLRAGVRMLDNLTKSAVLPTLPRAM